MILWTWPSLAHSKAVEAVPCTRSLQEIFLKEKHFYFPWLHVADSTRQFGRPATLRSHTALFFCKTDPGKSGRLWVYRTCSFTVQPQNQATVVLECHDSCFSTFLLLRFPNRALKLKNNLFVQSCLICVLDSCGQVPFFRKRKNLWPQSYVLECI